jgi:glycosyltransferase involved in cell wall biosynthesis
VSSRASGVSNVGDGRDRPVISGPVRPRVSVVIPAMNEGENIGWVIARLPAMIDEFVLVDGRSTDDTVAVSRAIRPDVIVVEDGGGGKGAALRAGFAAATGDYVVMLDADGSMDPTEIPAFVAALNAGADLVKGSRSMAGGGSADLSLLRFVGNRGLLAAANLLFGCSYSDLCYGYAAFRRDRILELELTAVGFEVETELVLRAVRNGLRVEEVPSFEAPRRNGSSKLNAFRDGWRILQTIMRERLRPARAHGPLVRPVAFPVGDPGLSSSHIGAHALVSSLSESNAE